MLEEAAALVPSLLLWLGLHQPGVSFGLLDKPSGGCGANQVTINIDITSLSPALGCLCAYFGCSKLSATKTGHCPEERKNNCGCRKVILSICETSLLSVPTLMDKLFLVFI